MCGRSVGATSAVVAEQVTFRDPLVRPVRLFEIRKAHQTFAPSDLARNGRLAWAYAVRPLGDPLGLSHDEQVIRIAADVYRHEDPCSFTRGLESERNSPSRWRFCPLSPLTFRFRVEPSS